MPIANAVRRTWLLWPLAVWLSSTGAQTFPVKPLRLVVPWPPGGGADFFARAVAEKLAASFGQQVIVDNRPGAGGTIGTELVARAGPDGYTLLLTTPDSLSISPRLAGKPTYDPLRDFAPVIMIASTPNILVVHPSLPSRSVNELIALGRSRPREINFASNGSGTLSHLTGELFKLRAGIDMVHIPYKGVPPALPGVVMGEA